VAKAQTLDPVFLSTLAGQGIGAESVGLQRDYAPRSRGKGYSPYARTFADNISGKYFSLISALPMVDAYGQGHELAWSDKNGVIESGNNIFHSQIDKGIVRLIALSDQPCGTRKDDEVSFHPQLFIGGAEVKPVSDTPKLINDPLNENYAYNTLEWDYGVCFRRIRLIEGRFLGSWIFTVPPKSDVTIKYNQTGVFRIKLQYAKDTDTEYIPASYFSEAKEWPVVISDSATFYPDADPETSSVDGHAYSYLSNATWSEVRNGAGDYAYDSSAYLMATQYGSTSTTDRWRRIARAIILFDTSTLGSGANISAATLSLDGYTKSDDNSWAPNVNIYSSAPVSNTAVVAGDFDSLGLTAYCDTPITYAGWNTSGYNDFVLNASGLAAINKTGVSKFGTRGANYDVADTPPAWGDTKTAYIWASSVEHGAGYQPKLVVTYTSGVTEKAASETGSGAEAKTSGSPIVIMSRSEAGSGAEVLGGRALGKFETGTGVESLGSRGLGRPETGSGREAVDGRALGETEAGSGLEASFLVKLFTGGDAGQGAETSLKIGAFMSADVGLGAELSWMLKQALAADSGQGDDTFGKLMKKVNSSSDLRLSGRAGRAGRSSRQTNMPSRRVNL
jgi:hypothetical protein